MKQDILDLVNMIYGENIEKNEEVVSHRIVSPPPKIGWHHSDTEDDITSHNSDESLSNKRQKSSTTEVVGK